MLHSIMGSLGFATGSEYFAKRSLEDFIKVSNNHAENLDKYLPYHLFDTLNDTVICDDGFVGSLLVAHPISGISNERAFISSVANIVENIMPQKSYLQFTLVASHKIEGVLDNWSKFRKCNGLSQDQASILNEITERRTHFLQQLAIGCDTESSRKVRDFVLYISFGQKISSYTEENIKQFCLVRQKLSQALRDMGVVSYVGDAQDFLDYTRQIVNQDNTTSHNDSPYQKFEPLSHQIVTQNNGIEVNKDSISHVSNNSKSVSFIIENMPYEGDLASIFNFVGDQLKDSFCLGARFTLNYIIFKSLNDGFKEKLRGEGNKVIEASRKREQQDNLNIHKEAQEWRQVIARLNEYSIVEDCWSMTVYSPEDLSPMITEQAKSIFRAFGWKLRSADCIQLPVFLSQLPLVGYYYWKDLKKLRVTKYITADKIALKLPIAAEPKAASTEGGVLFTGRRGQLFAINPFEKKFGNTNFNMSVAASSGAGKSVFLQELICSMLTQDVKVFALDIGRSFKNLCDLVGGEYLNFSYDTDLSLDPLRSITSGLDPELKADLINSARAILVSMCTDTPDKDHNSAMLEAMEVCLSRNGKLSIKDIAEYLSKSPDIKISRMGNTLYPFISDNLYGRFFDSKRKVASFKEPFTLIELENIKDNGDFISVVLQVILNQITSQFLLGDRSQKFIILIDEGWKLLQNSAFALSVAELFRIIRKYRGSIVVCQQALKDYYINEGCRTILQNSDWHVIMRQKSTSFMRETDDYKDIADLAETLKSVPGLYSEALISIGNESKVLGRLMLDPLTMAMFSTDGQDRLAIDTMLNQGATIKEALNELAKKYTYSA